MPSSTYDDNAAQLPETTDLEYSTVAWLREELEDAQIVASDNFLDIGGHSLAFARLNKFLSDSFGVNLDMKVAYDEPLSVAVAKAHPVRSHA
ncbi:phosphopantetheine-binding protein [Streptomyces sp. NBC_00859]|uniref:phosphopantetheine-binding protein n=1 Tax=Streptomyces sp. NBC_00859 TaxID=2903682 RepID=UPI00386DD878|nr:phosphopantetheine-binding protein [Streptomyces sp. NBC_00859]